MKVILPAGKNCEELEIDIDPFGEDVNLNLNQFDNIDFLTFEDIKTIYEFMVEARAEAAKNNS
jgi:hypothetical protein